MTPSNPAAIPKYILLAEHLRKQIERGILKPGDRLPSFVEMRVEHGVAPVTVERIYAYLEKDDLVVREQGRGTFVKAREVRPAMGVIALSGASFSYSHHPYFAHILEGCYKVAAQAGVKLLLLNDEEPPGWDEKVDGLLICEGRPDIRKKVLSQLPPGVPCVSALIKERGFVSVLADDYQGAYDLTQHFIDLGHRRIGYIHAKRPSARFDGYRDALRDAGIEMDESLLRDVGPELSGYVLAGQTAMSLWLSGDWPVLGCTALMTQNDDVAIGVIHALLEGGYRVPKDISVAGFDGTEIGRHFRPRLTSVEVPLAEIGAKAMSQLLQQISGEKMDASTIVLPTRVLPGASVSSMDKVIAT